MVLGTHSDTEENEGQFLRVCLPDPGKPAFLGRASFLQWFVLFSQSDLIPAASCGFLGLSGISYFQSFPSFHVCFVPDVPKVLLFIFLS